MNELLNQLEHEIYSRSLLLPLDILLVGATGVGKSSTINAIFGNRVAKVGEGCDPETQIISSYRVKDYFRVHDSAGLGDGISNDEKHAKNIINELLKTVTTNSDKSTSYGFIDMVMVILDGSSRDLGTTYQLLKNVILPIFDPKRIIVVINQADMAMKGRYWNHNFCIPEQPLIDFLEEKSKTTQDRIKEATGLTINRPIYYSAEYSFNIDKIISHIKSNLPRERRIIKINESTKQFIY
ncbi:GTPase family protein [Acinetobacter radioresistens]|uniref:GTPase family protein n=1 Tax=Acinetobacter radioresistens TaxID=40216 RepID=UPI003A80B5D1